ncbi:hypothetical protein Tsubulata_004886 [Turnera subulata]|uniref:KIB1-4 beta-propeller domain-containing protein n=1 Tax=Turnera subulata TaxID=218843 RepID=A0A9Q0G139_9ROSI|nr:hypothetical protein Tsubulata_004886 [Turnera subulata]
MDSSSRQWATLPADILWKISRCLESRLDILRCRWVCHSWRSSVSPPPVALTLPYPIVPNYPYTGDGRCFDHLTLTETSVYSFRPLPKKHNSAAGTTTTTTTRRKRTKPWIVGIQPLESGKFVFKDLFDDSRLHDGCKEWCPKVLNLSDYSVNEIARTYRVEPVHPFSKVAVSSSFSEIDDGFAVMVLFGSKLYAWRKGDDKWTNVGGAEGFQYLSIAYHRGKFYAVCDDKLTVTIDPVTLDVREVVPAEIKHSRYSLEVVLVECFGDLLLVEKCWLRSYYGSATDSEDELSFYNRILSEVAARLNSGSRRNPWELEDDSEDEVEGELEETPFAIEKLDEEKHRWVQEEDGLKDRVLFIFKSWSLLVLAKDFPGYNKNCIYFQGSNDEYDCDHPCADFEVYKVKDNNFEPLCTYSACNNPFGPPPDWVEI